MIYVTIAESRAGCRAIRQGGHQKGVSELFAVKSLLTVLQVPAQVPADRRDGARFELHNSAAQEQPRHYPVAGHRIEAVLYAV
jgi:hypothetical protein